MAYIATSALFSGFLNAYGFLMNMVLQFTDLLSGQTAEDVLCYFLRKWLEIYIYFFRHKIVCGITAEIVDGVLSIFRGFISRLWSACMYDSRFNTVLNSVTYCN